MSPTSPHRQATSGDLRDPPVRRILVCGGRSFRDTDLLEATLEQELAASPTGLTIVHGGASGADAIANAWAWGKRAKGLNVRAEPHPADWARYGKAAGPIRNGEMVDSTPDLVLAFQGGDGTADCVRQAQAAGLEVRQVR